MTDKVGDGSGIGRCQAFESYKSAGASIAAQDKAFKSLGDKTFWRGTLSPEKDTGDRICKKYVAMT